MKVPLIIAALCSCVALLSPASGAEAQKSKAKEKSAADVAIDQLSKLRADAVAKPGEQKFQPFIDASIAWITTYPTHSRAPAVVRTVGLLGLDLKDKDARAQRGVYASRLQYTIIDVKYRPETTDAARTALAALDAAVAEAVVRDTPSRDSMQALREKIDALATQPEATRFLVDAERSYFDITSRALSPAAGEKHLRKLLGHSDKAVAAMAQDELNLVEMRKEPFAFTFTALDGKAVDCAQFRGKVVAVVFWSAKDDRSRKEVESLRQLWSDIRRSGFEVVMVSADSAEDKETLEGTIKNLKLSWPVCYDGQGLEHPLGKKLNVRKVPAVALFDQKGILVATNLDSNRTASEAKRLLGIQDQPANDSGSRRRRR